MLGIGIPKLSIYVLTNVLSVAILGNFSNSEFLKSKCMTLLYTTPH